MPKTIQILDCTLRDGGHVNSWNFGHKGVTKIIDGLISAKIDFIEMGFLREVNFDKDKTLFPSVDKAEEQLKGIAESVDISLMIRPDWIDFKDLPKAKLVNTLRWAFYEKDLGKVIEQVAIARDSGYKVFLNPINIFSYSDEALGELLRKMNEVRPEGVSIVDTFGSLLPKDLSRYLAIFDSILDNEIKIGLHLHENLSISLALAIQFIEEISKERSVIIDSSLMGMGRAPGNLPTELIAQFLNRDYNKNYVIPQILKKIDECIIPFKKKYKWGYSPEYSITAIKQVHRSYAETLREDLGATLDQVNTVTDEVVRKSMQNVFDESFTKATLEVKNG